MKHPCNIMIGIHIRLVNVAGVTSVCFFVVERIC
jgi:hypothetical protein